MARGLCTRHYAAWQRAGKPDGPGLQVREPATCADPGCPSPVYARGHCSRHYRQLLRGGAVLVDHAPLNCAVAFCGRKAVTRGWCHGHYLRWSRHGDLKPDLLLSRPVHDVCTVEGCERGARYSLYCRTHYNRFTLYGDPLAGGPIRVVTGDGSISHGYWHVTVTPERAHLVPDDRKKDLEHRLVMAAALGRPLHADETVHHRNGDRLDNSIENLELWSTAQPKGQRVSDKVEFARQILARYDPESAPALGWDPLPRDRVASGTFVQWFEGCDQSRKRGGPDY